MEDLPEGAASDQGSAALGGSAEGADIAEPNRAPSAGVVTRILRDAAAGEPGAQDRLLAVVYNELRQVAGRLMEQERKGHTLQPTALVHEAYLRLLGKDEAQFESRGHFFRAAAEAMRKILIDHARRRGTQKRGGGRAALALSDVGTFLAGQDPAGASGSSPECGDGWDGLLALDEAISRLEVVDPGAAEVVRLRFFAGLGESAVAAALGVSERTVRRDWAFARGWLREALERDDASEG